VRGLPSLVNGVGLRTPSLRGSWVRIPPPALNLKFRLHVTASLKSDHKQIGLMSERLRSMRITSPPGQKVFDLHLTVESRPSILAKIATILGERNIDILAGGIECSDDMKTGYDLFYLEMANANVTPEELVKTLKAQSFVKEAEIEPQY
jgi:predicted regulator of amino acid metabolism with ACT domain